jgi:hypothetical protein
MNQLIELKDFLNNENMTTLFPSGGKERQRKYILSSRKQRILLRSPKKRSSVE